VIDGVIYDRVPARALVRTGPRHTERNGVRVGRGSVIPEWIDTAPTRSIPIRRPRRHPLNFYPTVAWNSSSRSAAAVASAGMSVPRMS